MTGSDRISSTNVAIIGTGFAGLGMGYYLKKAGVDSFTIFEKAADVGGVWRENTYPNAGCDVPSHLYSFSFEPRYPWTYRYAKQAEILAYLRHCAVKFDLTRHIRFEREVAGADFDERRGVWQIRLSNGERHEAKVLISAVGQLHRPSIPEIPGQELFAGTAFHSARWNHGYDLSGKTVAVIGTGASAVQFVPEIAKQVKKLYLFQRSPGWVAPKFEKPFSSLERKLFDALPLLHDLDRLRIFLITECLGYSYRGHRVAEWAITALARIQLRLQVKSPALRKKLTPNFPIGCKRILLTTEWLRALTRPNVEVIANAIIGLSDSGVRTADGSLHAVDAVIYGTGFAATDLLAPMQIRGLQRRLLNDDWKAGAQAYLGMSVSGYPNFFMLYGPNTNLGSGSIVFMLERQQRYIVKALEQITRRGLRYMDVRADAQLSYNGWLRVQSRKSTYEGNCQSWYKNADGVNINNWIGSQIAYARLTRNLVLGHYRLVGDDVAFPAALAA